MVETRGDCEKLLNIFVQAVDEFDKIRFKERSTRFNPAKGYKNQEKGLLEMPFQEVLCHILRQG